MAASRVVALSGAAGLRTLARRLSSRISACTARFTGGTGSSGWQTLTPWLQPPRRAASSTSIAPPRQEAPGAQRRRPFCFAAGFWGRPCLPPVSDARQQHNDALAGGDSAEGNDRRPRRAGSAPRALRDHPRQPLDFILSPSWRYWLAELNIHLTNQTDVMTILLPERLRFLYPLLQLPLWVWRHAAKRRVAQ